MAKGRKGRENGDGIEQNERGKRHAACAPSMVSFTQLRRSTCLEQRVTASALGYLHSHEHRPTEDIEKHAMKSARLLAPLTHSHPPVPEAAPVWEDAEREDDSGREEAHPAGHHASNTAHLEAAGFRFSGQGECSKKQGKKRRPKGGMAEGSDRGMGKGEKSEGVKNSNTSVL